MDNQDLINCMRDEMDLISTMSEEEKYEYADSLRHQLYSLACSVFSLN